MSWRHGEPLSVIADFEVLAESGDWLAVNKPAPLLVHPSDRSGEPTLWHGLRQLLIFECETGGHPALINRLDRETSGITLVSKTSAAASELGKAMQKRLFQKEYLALVTGHPGWDECRADFPILRQKDVQESRVWIKQCIHPEGRPCLTDFTVLARLEREGAPFALVLCRPHTGRMHQIRVHLSHLGHPLAGDKIYGPSEECYLEHIDTGWTPALEERLLLPRHALHASRLRFPYQEEMVDLFCPPPLEWDDFMGVRLSDFY